MRQRNKWATNSLMEQLPTTLTHASDNIYTCNKITHIISSSNEWLCYTVGVNYAIGDKQNIKIQNTYQTRINKQLNDVGT